MIRGIERRTIFYDAEDYEAFLSRLGFLVPELGFRCFGWVLMPNHVHLALQTGSVPLPRLMARLGTGYARAFNRRHDRVGHLFQNRYRSRLVNDDRDLLGLILYIHRNPLRAGLVEGPEALGRFPWCGHGALTGERRPRSFETPNATLRLLADSPVDARQQLAGLMQASDGPELLAEVRLEDSVRSDDAPTTSRDTASSIDELIISVCEAHDLTRDALGPGRRGARVIAARADLARRATRELGLSSRAVARALGVSDATVSRSLTRNSVSSRGSTRPHLREFF